MKYFILNFKIRLNFVLCRLEPNIPHTGYESGGIVFKTIVYINSLLEVAFVHFRFNSLQCITLSRKWLKKKVFKGKGHISGFKLG